jgi:SAM-dependent methyltransferase
MMRTAYGEIFATRSGRYERAMTRMPAARDAEFATFCRHLQLTGGETLVDVPAGGAYLRRYLADKLRYIAVDESEQFFSACGPRLRPTDRAINATCLDMPLAGDSVDIVGSLTGLHHVFPRQPVYAEWYRVLCGGGRVVIADVPVGSVEGTFLNGFVDHYNSQGHDGRFLDHDDVTALRAAGFAAITVTDERYTWKFAAAAAAEEFCLDLFGLDQPGAAAALAITLQQELGLHADPAGDGWLLPWGLRVITARKPPAG